MSCKNVPHNVRDVMLDVVAAGRRKKLDTNENRLYIEKAIMDETYGAARRANIPADEEGQIRMALRESLRDIGLHGSGSPPFNRASRSSPSIGKASGSGSCSGNQTRMDRFYRSPSVSKDPFDIDLARSMSPSQPRIDIMLQGDGKVRLGKALSMWFHANDIPGKKADCPYFRAAIKLAQQLGEVPIPWGKEIDGPYLEMNYDDLQVHMAEFKGNWGQFGVTIMCDSWTGPTMMCIINFMVFCNGRMFFHKSINATGRVQNAEFIRSCIREVIVEEIGEEFVVQLVTDNGSNYKKACKQLTDEFPHITWQPCAAHTINLMLKDIGRFDEVAEVVDSAKRICRFFYNHNRLLSHFLTIVHVLNLIITYVLISFLFL